MNCWSRPDSWIDIANHGQEAIDMLDEKAYECVLMDLQMPVMDGLPPHPNSGKTNASKNCRSWR